jgi:hypothetical protein
MGSKKARESALSTCRYRRHIPFPKLIKKNLTQAIQELQSESIRKRAAETGKRIKPENGLQHAVDWVEKRLRTAPISQGVWKFEQHRRNNLPLSREDRGGSTNTFTVVNTID